MSQLQRDLGDEAKLLHRARQELQKNSTDTLGLQKGLKDMVAREQDLSGRMEAWKAQWNKLHPAVDGLKKDVVFLKQRGEDQYSCIHGLQRDTQSILESFEDLRGAHAKMGADVEGLQMGLHKANQSLVDAQDNIGSNASFANGIHTRLE